MSAWGSSETLQQHASAALRRPLLPATNSPAPLPNQHDVSSGAPRKSVEVLEGQTLLEKQDWPGWKSDARTLRDTTDLTARVFSFIFLALIPACFIGLGIAICSLRDKTESTTSRDVVQAAKVASTLWPIAFAAVVGTMSRVIALYRAERSVKLGVLELFMRSQTLFNTIKESFGLRILSLWTVMLLAIWAFSPAGGIAVDQILSLRNNFDTANVPLIYYPNTAVGNLTVQSLVSSASGLRSSTVDRAMMYGSVLTDPGVSLLAAEASSPDVERKLNATIERITPKAATNGTRHDLWGNVRIPFLHALPGFDEKKPYDWVKVSLTKITQFSSLLGMPIRGINDTGAGNMTLQLSSCYHSLECSAWETIEDWVDRHPSWNGSMSFSSILSNASYPNTFLRHVEPNWNPANSSDEVFLKFGYTMREENVDNMLTVCGVTVEYVDVQIECSRLTTAGELDCVSTALRRTRDPGETPHVTATSFYPWGVSGLDEMTSLLASGHPAQAGPFELYLADPIQGFSSKIGDMPSYKDLPLSVFQSRLSLLLNTYWHMSLNTSVFLGIDGVTPSTKNNTEKSWLNELEDWAPAMGSWTTPAAPTYQISPAWMALYFVATAVLTLCALVAVILQSRIRAPDFLGSMSTLTRDSPYVTVPPGGSGLEGSERARLLKNMWVRIQDIRPGEAVGKIAFSDDKNLGAKLEWKRLYE
ncbi:hypothetical protein BC567DRAFT_296652 [Phyllosticta citribraziliensis]